MAMPVCLRTVLRLALLTGSVSSCASYPEPYAATPEQCATAMVGGPCPAEGATCGYARYASGSRYLYCDEQAPRDPRWVQHTVPVGGPLLPPELPA